MVRTVMMKYFAFILLIGVSITLGEEETKARLLASKNVLDNLLVEGKEILIQYDIYNVGASPAIDVELKDSSFLAADFKVVHGFLNVKWPRIAPASNVSHTVVVQPLRSGEVNFTSAEVYYHATEDSTERQFGYTSSPGEGYILSFRDFDRKYSPHVLDWAAFAIMTLPSLGIPLMLWYGSKSKYDKPKEKKL